MNELVSILKNSYGEFSAIVNFQPQKDRLVKLDFTDQNRELTTDILEDTSAFTAYINQQLQKAGARYGIGGYNEHRTVYRMSSLYDGDKENAEPRRLHLGIDIWGKPGTAVMAPLDGIVHSFAFNNRRGDYGVTIILSHYLHGISFYSLYGHLGLTSITNLQEGMRISKGDIFAAFGIPLENGHWPPHLHFQLIGNIDGWKGDFPGVCKFSERDVYLANCPDPDLVLDMMKFVC